MKKVLLSLTVSLGLFSSLNADILSGVTGAVNSASGGVSSVYNTTSSGVGTVLNNGKVKSVLDSLGNGSIGVSDLKTIAGEYGLGDVLSSSALDKLSAYGEGANLIYQYCYDFEPPSIKNPLSLLNPCDMLKFNGNPCSFAPSLSALGLNKKSGEDLKRYCATLGKGVATTPTVGGVTATPPQNQSINKNIQNINSDVLLNDRYKKINVSGASSTSSGGGGGTSSSKKSNSSIATDGGKSVNNSSISLAKNSDNQDVQKVVLQNNYKGYKLLEDANSVSNNTIEKVDLSKLSNGYKTLQDYKDSITNLTQLFRENENSINLTYLKNTVNLTFTQINSATSDVAEQDVQKEAEGANLLKVFKEQVELWKVSEIQKRIWISTKENEQIVNPTEELLDSTNDTNTRIAMVYFGEKAKNEKAKLVSEVEILGFDAVEKAKAIIEMAKIKHKNYDRAKEYTKIINSLSGVI